MPPIGELTRIEQVHLDRLERQGIFTTGLLLEVSETATRRQTLADQASGNLAEALGSVQHVDVRAGQAACRLLDDLRDLSRRDDHPVLLAEHADRVPEDYERRQTLANAERFTTPPLKEWESKVLGAEERILQLESEIFGLICRQVAAETARIAVRSDGDVNHGMVED